MRQMAVRRRFLFLAMVFAALVARADFLDLDSPDPQSVPRGTGGFIHPNETSPSEALPVWKRAKDGVYISVGTDRGFIGASLAPGVSHLLLLDNNPLTVTVNRVNINLLAMAGSRQDYLDWRTRPVSYDEWQQRIGASSLDMVSREFMSKQETWVAWQWNVVRSPDFTLFHSDPRIAASGSAEHAFRRANYLFYDAQFRRLQKMAREGKISAHLVDLSKPEEVSKVAASLQRAKLGISVLDVSNAWDSDAMTPEQFASLLTAFGPAAEADSILLLTDLKKNHSAVGAPEHWTYWDFKLADWTASRAAKRFARRLQRLQRKGLSCKAVLREL